MNTLPPMPQPVYNHDHIGFDEVRKNQAVHQLSRYTPPNEGIQEPLDVLQARSEEVAKGMRWIMDEIRDETLSEK